MYLRFNFLTILRFIVIVGLSVGLVLLAPGFKDRETWGILTNLADMPISTIFAIVIGFYIYEAIERKKDLDNNISIELSRIRRIYHLNKGMNTTPELAAWSKKLRELVIDYLKVFKDEDFLNYSENKNTFRNLSHHIYTIKDDLIRTLKDNTLFKELLETTRECAMVRQNIAGLLRHKISIFNWFVTLVISFVLVFALLNIVIAAGLFITKIISGLAILTIFLLVELLWEINTLNKGEREELAERYIENIESLEKSD